MQMDGIIREVHFNLPGFRLQIQIQIAQECDRSGGWDHSGCWHLGPARRDAACRIHPIHAGAHWSVDVYGHHGTPGSVQVTVLTNVTQPQKIKVTGHIFLDNFVFLLGLRGCPI